MGGEFMTDVQELRRRAREHVEKGAVTGGYRADVETAVRLLNEALATELVCVLRYKRHYFTAQGIHSRPVAEEFLEHANEEQEHADQIAERIDELGGKPDFDPKGMLTRSHSEYVEGDGLIEMVREDLVAERIAIESYTEMIRYFGDRDPTTRRMLEEILAREEEHAQDLMEILSTLGPGEPTDVCGTVEPTTVGEAPEASAAPRDLGYGASHGYDEAHGGPSGPGDLPAKGPETRH